jgi:hypothetical protein
VGGSGRASMVPAGKTIVFMPALLEKTPSRANIYSQQE